ncbi:MAG: DUF1579 family protein [Anaeromyxobacter sp.]
MLRSLALAALTLAALLLVPAIAPARAGDVPGVAVGACSGPEYHRLDFWIGAWDVRVEGGGFDGDDRVEPILGGCAVRESWTDADGSQGESLFFHDRSLGRWKQVWVTSEGTFKEKQEVEAPEGAIRFQGVLARPGGGTALDRTTLRRLPDGGVSQRIEQSLDGGKTWNAWEGVHVRKEPACTSSAHHALDFWLGDWDATVRTRKAPQSEEWEEAKGSNHVTRADGGCTVVEDFHAAGPKQPWTGRSVSQFVPAAGRWRQTWVDEGNSFLAFTGGPEGADFVLTGEPKTLPDGGTRQMRMVFTAIERDAFLWRWEATLDGGKSWRPQMLIDYRRHRPAPQRRLERGRLVSAADPAASFAFERSFVPAGGQTVDLFGIASAEQHFFVDAAPDGSIRRFYWLQFEHFLPGNDRVYDYSGIDQRPVQLGPLACAGDVRVSPGYFTMDDRPGSDSKAAERFLREKGFKLDGTFATLRLFHLPDRSRRRELMIIYGEVVPPGASENAVTAAITRHAREHVEVRSLRR